MRAQPSRRRVRVHPVVVFGRARRTLVAGAGLSLWKMRLRDVAAHLEPADVLVDAMRGRHTTWTRVRVNLQHVPEAIRPSQDALDPNEDMSTDWLADTTQNPPASRRRHAPTRKES